MMASIINVLTGSFRLLLERPVFFLPKLFSTAVGALWFIGIFSRTGPLSFYVVTTPLLVFFGVFVSIMLAAMVRQKDSESPLRAGFGETVERWRELLVSSAVFVLLGIALYIPFTAGLTAFYLYGSFLALLAGAAVSVLMLLAAVFLAYFFPISLLEQGSVIEGFRDSASTSMRNSSEVVALTLFSFALLFAASLTGDGGLQLLGYTGFFLARIVSGIVTTYVFVVSPSYYLES